MAVVIPKKTDKRVMTTRADMAAKNTTIREWVIAMMAAMKKVLSPNSEIIMTERVVRNDRDSNILSLVDDVGENKKWYKWWHEKDVDLILLRLSLPDSPINDPQDLMLSWRYNVTYHTQGVIDIIVKGLSFRHQMSYLVQFPSNISLLLRQTREADVSSWWKNSMNRLPRRGHQSLFIISLVIQHQFLHSTFTK